MVLHLVQDSMRKQPGRWPRDSNGGYPHTNLLNTGGMKSGR